MNVCSMSVALCLVFSSAAGGIAGGTHSAASAVAGVFVGIALGLGSAFGVVALERVAFPAKGRKAVVPLALFFLFATAAPVISAVFSVLAANAISSIKPGRKSNPTSAW